MQNSLPYHADPEMIPFGVPTENLQYHNKIIIFLYNRKVMIIFRINEGTNIYSLLTFYKSFDWFKMKPLDAQLTTSSKKY